MSIQHAIGGDIMMQLDDVVSSLTTGPRVGEAMERSVRWLDRCIEFHQKSGRDESQNLFAIVQGGLDPELRERCLEQMVQRKDGVAGFAIGGLSGGEAKGRDFHRHAPCAYILLVQRCLLENVGDIMELPDTQAHDRVALSNVPIVYLKTVITSPASAWFAHLQSMYFRSKVFNGYRFRRGWAIHWTNTNSVFLTRNVQTYWYALP